MPSPFPGMDPYLEDPDVFPDFHDRLVTHLSEAIQRGLPPPYFASLSHRVWIEVSERCVGPDVSVAHAARSPARGGAAVAEAPVGNAVVVHVPHDERREPLIEIRVGRGKDARLVTAIEVLSPSNKTSGEHGRDLYLRKQREMLEAKVNLVEIDLLRGGLHTTAVPRDRAVRAAGAFDYHVSIHRMDNLEDYLVYPIQLVAELPSITIPLLPGDEAVTVSLQQVMDRCYDGGPYRWEIDYSGPIP
ncbi:MAG: DUF4058 family protein, partial [Actinomycetota bacterium]